MKSCNARQAAVERPYYLTRVYMINSVLQMWRHFVDSEAFNAVHFILLELGRATYDWEDLLVHGSNIHRMPFPTSPVTYVGDSGTRTRVLWTAVPSSPATGSGEWGLGQSPDCPKVFHYFQQSGWPLLTL